MRSLRLAKQFDFVIFEDDAYYYIDYRSSDEEANRSYLALEAQVNGDTGRVVRFDSLSKVVSAGMRIGILTAPTAVVAKVNRITENIKYGFLFILAQLLLPSCFFFLCSFAFR